MIDDRIAVVVGAREAGYAVYQSTSLFPMCWLGVFMCKSSEYYMLTSIIAKKKKLQINDTRQFIIHGNFCPIMKAKFLTVFFPALLHHLSMHVKDGCTV